jgi:Zn-dependent metalloprotease
VAGTDASAARAQQNSELVLNYYASHFNRDSYDGNGSPLVSIVHGGLQFDNAYWSVNDKLMLYGDGDGKVMGDFTQGVDVAGHEMTHGVTMATAQLSMMGESGALNEANSDFFGIMIANGGTDWVLGKQLFLPGAEAVPGQENAVRDLANPGNITFCAAGGNGQCTQRKPDPATMNEMMPTTDTCDDSNDNCWVHINATILGHASYLVSQAIGAQKAEQLYYNTLTQSLSTRDNLATAAQAYKQTCSQLFDADTCTKVSTAFSQVGL